MTRFWYKARDMSGKNVTGFLRAEHEKQAYESIREAGLFVVCLKAMWVKSANRPLKSKILAEFCGQVSVMLKSGIPAVQAVHMLSQKVKNSRRACIYEDVYYLLLQGYGMSEALKLQNGVFPLLMVNMIRAGEMGGHMTETLDALSVYYEKEQRMRRKIESALIYPLFLTGLVAVTLLLMFIVVLPEFFALFESMESLPASTRFFIWLSEGLVSRGIYLLAALGLFVAAGLCLGRHPSVRSYLGRLTVHLPVAGSFMKTIYTARFSRTMSTLYGNGIPVIQAVGMAADVIGNLYIEKQMRQVRKEICEGVPLSAGIMKVDGLSQSLAVNVFVGEETGQLSGMLGRAADRFEAEAEEAARHLTALLEPVLIVLLGIVVGVIMISVMLPLMQYYQSIG